MDDLPDLSHLTEDERRIIEAVIHRQKAEEKRDAAALQARVDDYSAPVAMAGRRASQQTRSSSQTDESGICCEICQKTKFVGGESSARQCSICRKRFCVRCGVRLKANPYHKISWLCHICREKQERYFSSRKPFLPSTSSVSPLTGTSQHSTEENSKQISKQYVSDYILSQPFNQTPNANPSTENNLDRNGGGGSGRRRLLPNTQQFRRTIEKDPSSSDVSSEGEEERIHLKNPRWTPSLREEFDDGKSIKDDILRSLGLTLRYEQNSRVYVDDVRPGSVAAAERIRPGDRIVEWNGQTLQRLSSSDLDRVIEEHSIASADIDLTITRASNRYRTVNNNTSQKPSSGQIQLSFQHHSHRKEFHLLLHGATDLPLDHGHVHCRCSINDTDEQTSQSQACSSGRCTWNQRLIFFDINTLDNLTLTIQLFDEHEEKLRQLSIPLSESLTRSSNWYPLEPVQSEVSAPIHRALPQVHSQDPMSDSPSTTTTGNRKRQLPNIPAAQLHANREKVSQDLMQKATELKLRLHMQRATSVDQRRQMYEDRIQIFNNEAHRPTFPSMSNLNEKSVPISPLTSKDKTLSKPKIPIIREKSTPGTAPYLNPALARRTTTAGQHRVEVDRAKLKAFEEKYRKMPKKRESSETPGDDVDSDGSELSTVSKISSVSMLSTQSERPRASRKQGVHQHFHRHDEVQLNEEELRQMAMRTHDTVPHYPSASSASATTAAAAAATTTNNPPAPNNATKPTESTTNATKVDLKNDGTLSDSVLSSQVESNRKRRPSMSSKALVILGLSKKTNSASSLGHGKRCGFQRSEEIGVQPHLRSRALQRQTSKENDTPASEAAQPPLALSHQHHSMPHDMKLWSGALKLPHEHQFAEFIEGLGAGQLVGRQVLASPCYGEIQVGLRDQHGLLEVEIVRARNLLQKALYKMPPAPYVKVYLLDGKTCVEKQRTRSTRRTLDPLIQQSLIFKENYRDKVLQIGVWGDYGKLDRKVFMGVCQINLEELRLSTGAQVLDWYRLFSANSLLNSYTINQGGRTMSMTTNDSSSSLKSNPR